MSVCVYICVVYSVHVLTAAALCIFFPIRSGGDVFAAFLYSVCFMSSFTPINSQLMLVNKSHVTLLLRKLSSPTGYRYR